MWGAVPWASASLLAALLPAATLDAYRQAAAFEPDASATLRGLAPRRFLAENLVALLLALAWLAALASPPPAVAAWPLAARLACCAAALYAALLARTLGDFTAEPRALFAATQLPELRRPRYTWYLMRLRARMAPLRAWWLLSGLAHTCFALPPACVALSCDGCLAALSEPPGAELSLFAWLLDVTLLALPVLLAALAAFSLCHCAARDFSGRESRAQAAWLWPVGQIGEVLGQVAPDRVLSQKRAPAEASALLAAALLPPSDAGPAAEASRADTAGATAADALAAATEALRRQPSLFRPLRVVLLTIGTRGDVQPFLALGAHFIDCGHHFTIASSRNFRAAVEDAGIDFFDIGVDQIVQPDSWTKVTSTAEMIRVTAPTFLRDYRTVADGFRDACLSTAGRADVVLGTGHTLTFALNIAEGLGIPCWVTRLSPEIVSAGATMPGNTLSSLGWLNEFRSLAYWVRIALVVTGSGINDAENLWRRESLGLTDLVTSDRIDDMGFTPMLLGFSKHLFPKPTDYPLHAFQCGFWQTGEGDVLGLAPSHEADFEDEDEGQVPANTCSTSGSGAGATPIKPAAPRLAAELRHFVEKQIDPVLGHKRPMAIVTFGSMTNRSRPSLVGDIVTVLLERNMRVLVLTGWRDRAATEHELAAVVDLMGVADANRVFVWDEAPHEYVFPHAYFIVHHGGAGTTARALSCGVPSIVIPVLRWADQTLYGSLVEKLGVGVLVIEDDPSKKCIADAVARVMASAKVAHHTGSALCDRANRVGSAVRAERAAETALALIESCLCRASLSDAEAEAILPRLAVGGAGHLRALPEWSSLSKAQRMCVKHCVVCRRVRAELCVTQGAAEESSRGGIAASPLTPVGAAVAALAAASSPGPLAAPTSASATAKKRRHRRGSE